jgi:putative transposase
MPRGLERRYGYRHLHFITFSCYHRLPLLGSMRARNIFVKLLGEVRVRFGVAVLGYVVMPEHVHLLITEPPNSTPSRFLQVLKQRVSRELGKRTRKRVRGQLPLHFESGPVALPHLWQPRFHDFNVWSRKKRNEKIHYMHRNPVQRALVQDPKEWPWSSYSFYFRRGIVLLSMDRVE